MGNCCLKSEYQTMPLADKEEFGDVNVETYEESSKELKKNGINDESSKQSSFTDEEREAWVASQWSEPGEEVFFSK